DARRATRDEEAAERPPGHGVTRTQARRGIVGRLGASQVAGGEQRVGDPRRLRGERTDRGHRDADGRQRATKCGRADDHLSGTPRSAASNVTFGSSNTADGFVGDPIRIEWTAVSGGGGSMARCSPPSESTIPISSGTLNVPNRALCWTSITASRVPESYR